MTTFYLSTGSLVVKGDILANDTLSGLAARNGVTPVAGDLMLATAQTDQTQNGPYIARSGAWDRVISVQTAQLYYVSSGTDAGVTWQLRTAGITPASFNSSTGACGTNLSLVSIASAAGAFNPAAPGPIGGTTPAAVTGTVGTFDNLVLTGASPTLAAGQSGIGRASILGGSVAAGIAALNEHGGAAGLLTSASTATASAYLDLRPFSLANNATLDYPPENGGVMLVVVPGASSAPQAVIGFAANGAVTLNGVTPAGGISLTLDNANTLNVYASGGSVRFQNKVGSTINVLVVAAKFLNA